MGCQSGRIGPLLCLLRSSPGGSRLHVPCSLGQFETVIGPGLVGGWNLEDAGSVIGRGAVHGGKFVGGADMEA